MLFNMSNIALSFSHYKDTTYILIRTIFLENYSLKIVNQNFKYLFAFSTIQKYKIYLNLQNILEKNFQENYLLIY